MRQSFILSSFATKTIQTEIVREGVRT